MVMTGAGVSSESGIPTFRGPVGLWNNHRPEDLATPEAFENDPSLVWEWYDWRRLLVLDAEPNPAHYAISDLELYYPEFLVVTQNVDGLHRRAGSQKVLELHGSITRARCYSSPDHIEPLQKNQKLKEYPPCCPECGEILRPDVLWFGESYDEEILSECLLFAQDCDLILVVGTSGAVGVPAAIVGTAIQKGAISVEVNPEESSLTQGVDFYINGKAGEFMPKIISELQRSQ